MVKRKAAKVLRAHSCDPRKIHLCPRDNWNTREAWLLCDGYEVTLCKQRSGEPAEAKVTLDRRTFNSLVRRYLA